MSIFKILVLKLRNVSNQIFSQSIIFFIDFISLELFNKISSIILLYINY